MLKEAEEQEAENSNSDSDVTAESNKINKEDYKMIISMESYNKTLTYKETMKVDAKNIARNQKNIWIPIYEVIDS